MLRSLRFRLAALSSVIIAVALVGAGLLLRAQLGGSLLSSIDDTATSEITTAVADVDAGRLAAAGRVGAEEDTVVQVVNRAGVPIAASPNLHSRNGVFTFPATDHLRFHNTQRLPIGQTADSYRVAAVKTRTGSAVYVAVASDDRHDTLQSLDSALLVGLPSVIAVLALIAWLVIGRALRPVERLRQQAAAISETSLEQRLAPPSSTELRALADTLNELLDRVDQAASRQREFVADAAHELRSPIASLRTQIEVANAADQPEPQVLLQLIERLSRLVDDLLQLARLDDSRPPQLALVDLDDLVLDCVAEIRATSAVPIDISMVSAAQVTGDGPALKRLVRNLIANAAQHARSEVGVSLAAPGDEVELAVADDGPGIPMRDRQRVFERFTRLDGGRDRSSGGVGLGLAIAAEVAAAHRGTIEIRDNAPGTVFVVRLPITVSAESGRVRT